MHYKRLVNRKLSLMLLWVLAFQALFVAYMIPTAYGGAYWKYQTGGTVVSVGVSADGNYTVAGTSTGSVFLLNGEGSLLWSHNFTVNVECVAISGDGSLIVVGIREYRSGEPDICLFDNLGNIIWQKDLVEGSWPCDVAISPDAKYIVTGDTDNLVYFYDINGNLVWNYTAAGRIGAVSTSSGGEYTAAGSWDDTLYFFNKSGSLLWSKPFEYNVDAVSISPEGDYVAAGCPTVADLFLFANNGSLLLQTPFYISIRAVSVSANANRIAVADYKNITVIDRMANVICEREASYSLEDVAITSDGKYFAFGWDDNVYFFEALPPSEIQCGVSPSTIFLGSSVTINGSVQPQLSGEQIRLEYKLTVQDSTHNEDGFVTVTSTVTTSANGSFIDVFTPSDAGQWRLTATWSGGAEHMPSECTCPFFVNPAAEINLLSVTPVTLYWHRQKWYCEHGDSDAAYRMDMEMPTSSQSETAAFNPSNYMWMGHGHYMFTGIHTGQLSESITINEGIWNLSIWAAARDPNQHFRVALCFWDENHNANFIANWDTEYFNSTSPDVPTQFVHSFNLPAQIIPEGSCLGFIVYDCRYSDVVWFFDSAQHPSSLEIPPSTVYIIPDFPGYLFLPFVMSATLLALALSKRLKKQQKPI